VRLEERATVDLVDRIAAAIIEGFDRHYTRFRDTSAKAKGRFEAGEWNEAQEAVKTRISFYKERVHECVDRLNDEFEVGRLDEATWQQIKLVYIGMLVDHNQPELAETFFNSVITRVLGRTYVHNDFAFVRAAVSTEYIESDPPTYRSYYPASDGYREVVQQLFLDFAWERPFADLERDVDLVLRALLEHFGGEWPPVRTNLQVQALGSAFYRNKGAYVVGKIVNGPDEQPFVVPVLHDDEGRLVLDGILLDREDISLLFTLSRAYFMVDMDVPSGYVAFLQSLLPAKPRSELYTALGLGGQGKTLFVRDLRHHLHHSRDLFVEAPGTRGQVMHVFTLPSYPYVFKLIRDAFGPGKHTDRETVMRKFLMVKDVDRVGRMADTMEFKHLALPRDRFTPELLGQLEELVPSALTYDGENLIIDLCYVERRMTPLNVYFETSTPDETEHVVRDYGDSIRELAIANVFCGDLLWRNFGVNRHGRVVFYDYDEIEYLTDCVFRKIPDAPDPLMELSDEVWYPVGSQDVFPEEFKTFLLGDPRVHDAFMRHHADLLRPEFWWDAQKLVRAGEIVDFFPYPESIRFCNRFPA
jgi:isocitrate dehydrogenase kinase/phosphatase